MSDKQFLLNDLADPWFQCSLRVWKELVSFGGALYHILKIKAFKFPIAQGTTKWKG